MKLIIYCTEKRACLIRDAIQDKFHELKKSPSEEGRALASDMDVCAKGLDRGIRLSKGEEDTITVRI